jgi:hypothetical protein
MTELEIEKTHVEINELRNRIRTQLAQEHNWAEQEQFWQEQQRLLQEQQKQQQQHWQANQQLWQAQQQNWQALEKMNSIRNYILIAGIAATAGATIATALL